MDFLFAFGVYSVLAALPLVLLASDTGMTGEYRRPAVFVLSPGPGQLRNAVSLTVIAGETTSTTIRPFPMELAGLTPGIGAAKQD